MGNWSGSFKTWKSTLEAGPWINIKMSSCQYRKSHCGDKTILQPSYLHNGISYTDQMTSLYWIRAQIDFWTTSSICYSCQVSCIQLQSEWPHTGNDMCTVTYQVYSNGQIKDVTTDIVASLSTFQKIYCAPLSNLNRKLKINSADILCDGLHYFVTILLHHLIETVTSGPFTNMVLTLIPEWISNHTPSKVGVKLLIHS